MSIQHFFRHEQVLKFMYFINVLGAGIPGFLIVFFPDFAEKYILWPGQDLAVMAIVGSIWLSIGLVSVLGIFAPYRFLPVFLVQLIYKSIWLLSYILPNLQRGTLPESSSILVLIFLLLIFEFILFIRPKHFVKIAP